MYYVLQMKDDVIFDFYHKKRIFVPVKIIILFWYRHSISASAENLHFAAAFILIATIIVTSLLGICDHFILMNNNSSCLFVIITTDI